MKLSVYSELIESYLNDNLPKSGPANLYDPVAYILSNGGKRIRPALALMSCELFGADPKKALNAALSVERFHNFTLIHDDIMDQAAVRRGKPSVHEKWDVNAGILSGDVLMIRSYLPLQEYPAETAQELTRLFNRTAIEICEGQQMDMDFENQSSVQAETYYEMIKFKTAVLIGCALQMGALIAGADARDQQLIYDFGVNLGLAFQLQDDYLDSFGGEDFGKRIGGDILEKKKTLLVIRTREFCDPKDRDLLDQLYSEPVGESLEEEEQHIAEVKSLFVKYGADQMIQGEIGSYTEKALACIDQLQVEEARKQVLRDFSQALMNRKL